MIEYKPKYRAKLWHPNKFQYWSPVPNGNVPQDINFDRIECKIHDTVFKECSNDFIKAFAKERLWEKLKV